MRSRKAHPDVFNLLLQVMDHGTLTDNNGRKADFRHVIIVMTTNAGSAGNGAAGDRLHPLGQCERRHGSDPADFHPGVRNRLDAIIQFAGLDLVTIERVVDKLIVEVEMQLESKGVTITLDDAARRWIAEKGYDPEDGCPADGAHHPGAHQAAAGRRATLRTAGGRWLRTGLRREGRDEARSRLHPRRSCRKSQPSSHARATARRNNGVDPA